MKSNCEYCGKEFDTVVRGGFLKRFCCKYHKERSRFVEKKFGVTEKYSIKKVKCKYCGKEFNKRGFVKKFCCKKHKDIYKVKERNKNYEIKHGKKYSEIQEKKRKFTGYYKTNEYLERIKNTRRKNKKEYYELRDLIKTFKKELENV